MTDSLAAINAIRHVIQVHAGSDFRLGRGGNIDGIHWFGKLLGWTWPPSYIDVLSKHDGVMVGNAIIYSFLQSVEIFMILHQEWHRMDGYWPVATDGCGNYFVLAMGKATSTGVCPVEFIESTSGFEPAYGFAEDYAGFICQKMQEECEESECSVLKNA